MDIKEKESSDPREIYHDENKGKDFSTWRNWVKNNIHTTPIMETPDCDWKANYYTSEERIKFLTERNGKITRIANYLKIKNEEIWNNEIKKKIDKQISEISVNPTNKKRQLIFVFARLNSSTEDYNTYVKYTKSGSTYINQLLDLGFINTNDSFLHINPYDEVNKIYNKTKKLHLNQVILELQDKITHGGNPWEKYLEMKKRYDEILDYEAKLYTDKLHVARYKTTQMLDKFLYKKNEVPSGKPQVDIVYDYTHKNIYDLICILDNYNLENYEVKFYFPYLNQTKYRDWIVYNFINNRQYVWADAAEKYMLGYLNILLHTLLLRDLKNKNIDVLIQISEKPIIIQIPKNYIINSESDTNPYLTHMLNFIRTVNSIYNSTTIPNYSYNRIVSPEKNLSIIDTNLIHSNEYKGPDITDLLFRDIKKKYDSNHEKNGTISSRQFIDKAIELAKKENNNKTGVDMPKIAILYGPPASGKTITKTKLEKEFGVNNTIVIGKDEIILNSDYYLADLLNLYWKLHEKAKPLFELKNKVMDNLVNTLFNTYFLRNENRSYIKFFRYISAYFYSMVEFAITKKCNIIVEVTGNLINHINDFRFGYIAGLLRSNGYKIEVHAIHKKFDELYYSNIFRSFSEFRIMDRSKLNEYANNAWKNFENIRNEYKEIDLYLIDNTVNFSNPEIIYQRVDKVEQCIVKNFDKSTIDKNEKEFIDLLKKLKCRVNIIGADGSYHTDYGLVIALIIVVIIYMLLKYFSNFWVISKESNTFRNPYQSSYMTFDVFI